MHANKENINRLLNTAKGQINGVQKMIDNNEYCIDIVNQLMATIAILKKTNKESDLSEVFCYCRYGYRYF